MINNKPSMSIFGLAFIGLAIVSLTGLALLAVLVDELAETGWAAPNLLRAFFATRASWQENTGNEFTGEVTALLFGASAVPVGLDLISKTVIRYIPLGESIKGFIRRINKTQRKYLMPFHTYLSVLALGVGILHLVISSCAGNPLPELALILSGILVATGLLFKWKALPGKLCKIVYQFHASLIVSGVLLVVLYIGHAVMGSD